MIAKYDPHAIRFSDPVFTDLQGDEPSAMWRMLVGRRFSKHRSAAAQRKSFGAS
jgi:hypothetical protein